jgi:hypothetical protein
VVAVSFVFVSMVAISVSGVVAVTFVSVVGN